jgi:hypothetical protein
VTPTVTLVPSPGLFYQINFEVQQVLQYVNYSQFLDQQSLNIDVFVGAMYEAVPYLLIPGYDTIYVTSVVEYYNNTYITNRDSTSLRLLQVPSVNDAILVIYNVTVGVTQLGYSSSDDLYNDLVYSISTACSGADSEFIVMLRAKDETGVYLYSSVSDAIPKIGAYVTVFVHSAAPSSAPSLNPTCSIGSYGDESGCQQCPAGTYRSSFELDSCTECDLNYYSSKAGSRKCTECDWPFSTYKTGSDMCSAVHLDIHGPLLLSPIIVVIIIFILALWSVPDHRLGIFLICLFPTIDIITDILYLLHTRFYDVYLFAACVAFLIISSSSIVYILFQKKLYPRMYGYDWISWCWWIGVTNGYPSVNGVIKVTSFNSHDSLPKVLYLLLCWLTFMSAQCICGIPLFFLIILHSPFYVLWLIVGAILFQMKMIALSPVWNFWISIWSDNKLADNKNLEKNHIVNTAYFNVSSVSTLVLETFPQLIIQCINSSLVSTWSTIGAVSIAMSGMCVLYICRMIVAVL